MPFLSKMISFWNNLFRRQRVERDLNDELHAYVEEMTARKIQTGLSPAAARDAVLLEIGGIDRIKDLVRQQRIGPRSLRTAAAMGVVAIVAFVSGAGAAVTAMRWSTPAPVAPPTTQAKRPSFVAPVLQGRVVDEATGQPVPNVEVGLRELPHRQRYTVTDDKGQFVFTNPPPYGFRLDADKKRWFINGSGDVNILMPAFDGRFSVSVPDVVVRDKNGQLLQGEPLESLDVSFRNDPKISDLFKRIRSFEYSSGAVELAVTSLPPGSKRAPLGLDTPTIAAAVHQ